MTQIGPSKIGKYDVEARIGEGAMGVVYRARDPVLARPVAIKVMSDAFAQNDDLRQRFLREAQAAGSLGHPNIITIYDFGDVDGHPYIAMEFVEGQDLAELLAHRVPLTLAHKLDIAIGLLQGLAFAHKRGIVHRDIKPANIRIDTDGNARIIDFGVVHLASSEMTRSGVMLGTPSYMAPEQIVGGKVGPQTDIFSAAAVLYELLTGKRPFAGETLQQVMYRVLSEPPAPLNELVPELPPRLNDVVTRALAKEPEDRYASGLEMANDLAGIRATISASPTATLSLRATIESALEGERKAGQRRLRRRHAVSAAAGVLTAAALVIWLLAGHYTRGGGTRAQPIVTGDPAPIPATVAPPSKAPTATLAGGASDPPRPTAQQTTTPKQPARTDPLVRSSSSSQSTAAPVQHTAARDSARSPGAGAIAVPPSPSTSIAPAPGKPADTKPAPAVLPTALSNGAPASVSKPAIQSANAPASSRPSASPASPPPVASSSNANAEISAVIDSYARAIESRDVATLRRTYATITPDQARAFSDFFGSTRELRASLGVQSLHVDGNSATARVSGVYQYTTNAGRAERQDVAFDVELRHDGGSWHLVGVR